MRRERIETWRRIIVTPVAVMLVAVTLLALPDKASASPTGVSPPGVVRHGDCEGGPSHWRLRVLDEGFLLSVRFALWGGAESQEWNVFLDRNGEGFFQGSRVSGPEGLVRVRRPTADGPDDDVIRAAGHNVVTGEICRGRVRIKKP